MSQSVEQQSERIAQPQWFDDRRSYWNGKAWVAATPRRGASGNRRLFIAAGILGFLALVAIVVGAGATALEANNHTTCDSGFGQLAQALDPKIAAQCAAANFIFYSGVVVGFLGGLSFLAALIIAAIGATRKAP